MMADQDDFEHQLTLEQEEARKQEQGYVYTDPNDGTVYEWDDEKHAWFPKVDDNFLAAYHANYGVYQTQEGDQTTSATQPTTTAPTPNTNKPVPKKAKQSSGDDVSVEESLLRAQREAELGIPAPVLDEKISAADAEHQKSLKRKKEEPTWFNMEESKNTNVYVSGLPTEDFTEKDFIELMSKCGIIMVDEDKNDAPKVKLYRDHEGYLKGDGRCCYLKVESVNLALQLLDDSEVDGKKIHVERAKFTMKGNFNPELKRKKKKPNKKKKAQKNFKEQDKLLDWRPEKSFQKKRFEQVVIIKHVFHPDEFEEDAMLINEIKDDLEAECKKYGEVKKVMIFDRHPDGVASVKFKDGDDADVCVLALNGRWFAKRQLEAEIWDGKTDYKVEETDKERDERLKKWQEFLEIEEDKEKKRETNTQSPDAQNENESHTSVASGAEAAESRVGESADEKPDATSETVGNSASETVTSSASETVSSSASKTVSNSDASLKKEDADESMETDRTDESKKEGSDELSKEGRTAEKATEDAPS